MKLSALGVPVRPLDRTIIGRVTFDPVPQGVRLDHVLAVQRGVIPLETTGYAGILLADRTEIQGPPAIYALGDLAHLQNGDVVALNPTGNVRTLYRKHSRHNFLLATERCNSLCLMCSQPPREVDDTGRVAEHLRVIRLMDPQTTELGITGGEPALLGQGFLDLVRGCREHLPTAALHVLTNGRLFTEGFARDLAAIEHPDLMLGIPLYSDIDSEHDYVVQARRAFDETLAGLHHLGRYGVRVEIRVVIHRQTYARLAPLADFIYHNLPFAAQIALMGLEPIGLAIPNLGDLWIDPIDYQQELTAAVEFLAARGMNVSIYNHQLCVVPQRLWPWCVKSIADWKNIYLPECDSCGVRDRCGGFFQSAATRHSAHIRALQPALDQHDS